MRRLANFCFFLIAGTRSIGLMIGGLLAIRPEQTSIADRIPGLGDCRSTYCKPQRRSVPEGHA